MIREKTKKGAEANSELCIPIETAIKQRKIGRGIPKKDRTHKINDNF